MATRLRNSGCVRAQFCRAAPGEVRLATSEARYRLTVLPVGHVFPISTEPLIRVPESGSCLEVSCPPDLHKKSGALWRTTVQPWMTNSNFACALPLACLSPRRRSAGRAADFGFPLRAGERRHLLWSPQETENCINPSNRHGKRDRMWSPDRISLRPDTPSARTNSSRRGPEPNRLNGKGRW